MNVDKCSIVVCTFNRLAYLKDCLSYLAKLNFPNYEIVVVNDGSTDGTKEFLDSVNDQKIRVVHHGKNQGLSQARNTGIQNVHYEIIAFTDDDCNAESSWLTYLLRGFVSEQIGFVIGATHYISKTYKGYFPERLVSNRDARWPMGCNIAYQKCVFDEIGGFDHSFFTYNNEDSEMALRAIAHGFSFNRAHNAVVYHQRATWTPKSLLHSARNASVWPILKKKYPNHYLEFGPPVKFGFIVNAGDYLSILTAPIFIPLLLLRYLLHGKRGLKIFFTKWPVYLLLRRYYIYKEAIKNRVLMI